MSLQVLKRKDVVSILRYETILVSGSALIGGIVIGIAISPFVEMIVSWSYALPMKFVVVKLLHWVPL